MDAIWVLPRPARYLFYVERSTPSVIRVDSRGVSVPFFRVVLAPTHYYVVPTSASKSMVRLSRYFRVSRFFRALAFSGTAVPLHVDGCQDVSYS